jgi:hypothetical protein
MVGSTTTLPVPQLPIVVNQLMLVARLEGLKPIEKIQVAAAVVALPRRWSHRVGFGRHHLSTTACRLGWHGNLSS